MIAWVGDGGGGGVGILSICGDLENVICFCSVKTMSRGGFNNSFGRGGGGRGGRGGGKQIMYSFDLTLEHHDVECTAIL